jgi:lantibiotic modifying enzyme
MRKLQYAILQFILCIITIALVIPNPTTSQIPTLPYYDDDVYIGYEYGTAGIINAMLASIMENSIPNNLASRVLNASIRALNQIWDDRIEFEGSQYPVWAKTPEWSTIFPGQKYGTPGILLPFIKLYQITNDIKWLNRAEEGYWFLASQAINDSTSPHWPYAYSMPKEELGTAITDIKYGSAGILDINLKLFEITNDTRYLDHAELIISWLESVSIEKVANSKMYQVIPWYYQDFLDVDQNQNNPYYTSYGFGLAGIAPLLYKYALLRNSPETKTWALSLGQFLKNIQGQDGSWFFNSDSDNRYTGFDEGVAGILFGLNKLNNLSETSEFDNSITKGIRWLFSSYIANYSHTGFFEDNTNRLIKTNLYRGTLGVLKALTELTEFLSDEQIDQLVKSYQWLITAASILVHTGEDEMLFLLQEKDNFDFIDFSYAEGVAGLLLEVVNLESNPSLTSKLNFNISRVINALISGLLYFQNDDGHWQRQFLIPAGWNIQQYVIEDYTENYISTSFDNSVTDGTSKTNSNDFETSVLQLHLIILIVYLKKNRSIAKS